MEPRPPRPRQQYLPQDAAPAAGGYQRGGTEPGMYAPAPGYGAPPPPYPNELDLVPRRDRYRQRIARNILIALLLLVVIGVAAWNVRDRFFTTPPDQNLAQLAPTPGPGVPAANPDPSTPTTAAGDAAPTQAPVNNLLATSTPPPEDTGSIREISSEATEPGAAPTPAPADSEQEPAADQEVPADLTTLLPEANELPVDGLTLSSSGDRTRLEVLASFGSDPTAQAEADALLEETGWTANVYNEYSADPSVLSPDATFVLTTSIHEFASQAAASEAIGYFANVVIAQQGFDEVQSDPIGDEIQLLRGVSENGTTNVVAYIVDGPLLYRLSGSSLAGDPTVHVLQLAEQLIGGS